MNSTRPLIVVASLLFPFALAACPNKDKDNEVPSAVVSAPPPPTVTEPPTAAVITPEAPDAGADADADAADAKVVTGGPSGLAKCCAAIAQNAKSAPPEQALLYAGFIAACKSGAIPPQFRSMAACK